MANVIVIGIIVAILGAAIRYIVKEKRRGVKCIGCPAAQSCMNKNEASGCTCGCCHSDTDR